MSRHAGKRLTTTSTRDHRERVDASREALDRLEHAHTAFLCELDRRKAAAALLDVVHSVAAQARAWV